MLMRISCLAAAALLAAPLAAQSSSSLTTTYKSDNNAASGGGVYFDLRVDVPVTIDRIDSNTLGAGTAGTVDLYTIPGGHTLTNVTSSSGWTLQGSAPTTSAGTGLPTQSVFTSMGNPAPFTLMPGLYGVAVCYNGLQPVYTNGNGLNQVYSNGDMTLTAGAAQNTYFSTATVFTPRVWNGTIYYTVPAGWGRWEEYGAGCPDTSACFYEIFSTGTFDLSGSAGSESVVQFIFTGTDYVVTPGTSAWFNPTSSPLALTDDSNSAPQMMPFTVSYPGGSTNQIILGSNGYIYLGNGNSPGAFYWPTAGIPAFVNDGPRHAPFWGDLDPSAGGTVNFDIDPSGFKAYATWTAVPEWSAAGQLSTFQIAIDVSGMIEYRYRSCGVAVAPALCGWSPGGGVRDPGPIDVSTAIQTGFLTGQDATPITLRATGRPVTGTTMSLDIGGIPNNTVLAMVFLGIARTPAPGVSLANSFGGMAGCYQHVGGSLSSIGLLVMPGSTGTIPLSIPARSSLSGLQFHCQSAAAIVPPAYTNSGFIASNGLMLQVGGM